MNIRIPESLQSSDGNGKMSKTIQGIAGVLVFFGASYTPLTEADWVMVLNQFLLILASFRALYGVYRKYQNSR